MRTLDGAEACDHCGLELQAGSDSCPACSPAPPPEVTDEPGDRGNPARIRRRDRGHCGRQACRCTHTHGCDHGWIDPGPRLDAALGQSYTHHEPCPVCRPEAVARMVKGSARAV